MPMTRAQKYRKKQLADLRELAVIIVPTIASGYIIRAAGGENLPLWQHLIATMAIVLCVVAPYRVWSKSAQRPQAARVDRRREE